MPNFKCLLLGKMNHVPQLVQSFIFGILIKTNNNFALYVQMHLC